MNEYEALAKANNKNITLYYGKAGTGKTHTLVHLIDDYLFYNHIPTGSNIAVVAPTHSAVKTVKQALMKHMGELDYKLSEIDDKICTIHSFFKISFVKKKSLGLKYSGVTTLFVDELSMIDRTTLNIILESSIKNIFFFGDPLQLPPIHFCRGVTYAEIDSIINQLNKINFPVNHLMIQFCNESPFQTLSRIKGIHTRGLTQNYRSNEFVLTQLSKLFNGESLLVREMDMKTIIDHIQQGYIFICAIWKILQRVHLAYVDDTYEKVVFEERLFLSELHFKVGDTLIANQTHGKFINGFEYTVTQISRDHCHEIDYVYLEDPEETEYRVPVQQLNIFSPQYIITVHRSQGRSIENTIICVDQLFDMTMLYTAISRSKTNFKLISFKGVNEVSFSKDFLKLHGLYYSEDANIEKESTTS